MSRHIPGDVFCPGILHLEYPLSTATFHRLVGTRNEMCLPSCFGVNGKGLWLQSAGLPLSLLVHMGGTMQKEPLWQPTTNASFKVPSRKARAPSSLPMSFLRLAELLVMSAVSYVSTRWFESGRLQAWLSCLFSETSKREQRDRNRKRWDERERRGVISPYKVLYFVESCSLVFLLLFPSLSPASSGAGLRATFPFPGQGQRHISSSRARPKPCASRPLQSTWLVLPDQAC